MGSIRMTRSARVTAGVVLPAMGTVVLATMLTTGPAAADVTAFRGSAYGESVNVTTLPGSPLATPVTSGPLPLVTLPPSGASQTKQGLGVMVPMTSPQVLAAGVLNVMTSRTVRTNRHLSSTQSSANVANVVIGGTAGLRASAVTSSCTADGNGARGTSEILGSNQPGLAVSPPPNTTIPVMGLGSVTFNEQIKSQSAGNFAAITVNAIHVHLASPLAKGDVIIAQSVCRVSGPDVLVTATTPPTAPPTAPPTTPPTSPPTTPPTSQPTQPAPAAGPATAQPGTARFTG